MCAFTQTPRSSCLAPATMHPRTVFAGPARKFVLGIDIGTTYAGMSYWYVRLVLSFLYIDLTAVISASSSLAGFQRSYRLHGNSGPELSLNLTNNLYRFPAQDHVGADSKVPSVIYYDQSGRARACGAEALRESVAEQAEEGGWEKAEWSASPHSNCRKN